MLQSRRSYHAHRESLAEIKYWLWLDFTTLWVYEIFIVNPCQIIYCMHGSACFSSLFVYYDLHVYELQESKKQVSLRFVYTTAKIALS